MPDWELISYVCAGIVMPLALASICLAISVRMRGLCKCLRWRRKKKYSTPVPEEGGSNMEECAPLIEEPEPDTSVPKEQTEVTVGVHNPSDELVAECSAPRQGILEGARSGLQGEEETVDSELLDRVSTSAVSPTIGDTSGGDVVAEASMSKLPEYPKGSKTIATEPPTVQQGLKTFTDDSAPTESGSKVVGLLKAKDSAEAFQRQDSAYHEPDYVRKDGHEAEPMYFFRNIQVIQPSHSPESMCKERKRPSPLRQESDEGYSSSSLSLRHFHPQPQASWSSVGSEKEIEEED